MATTLLALLPAPPQQPHCFVLSNQAGSTDNNSRTEDGVVQITPSSASAVISWDDIPSNSPYT